MNKVGHVFYYRKFIPKIEPVDLTKFSYKRVSDFGIVPIAYIEGYLPNAENIFMLSFPSNKYYTGNIFHETFSSLEELAQRKHLPWLLYADQVCIKKFKAEEVDEKTKLAAVSYQKNYFLEDYGNLFKDMIGFMEEKEIPVLEFIVKNAGKQYEILYDVFYDILELYIWHGSVTEFEYFHKLTEKIIREDIVAKILERSGIKERDGLIASTLFTQYLKYRNEQEELQKLKKNKKRNK